tara:strand:+ start:911 stop:1804 length:894 start_codon:yes stop_codon:yes gene_type:complete
VEIGSLPPLAAIRVFDAAARTGNFTLAASELGMSQASVSYQIKILEERVGGALFDRKPRGVELSPTGRVFAQRVGEALRIISDAYAEAQGATQGTLAISSGSTFATNYLGQRLGRFQVSHPQLSVRIEVSDIPTDFRVSGIDLAIRVGKGDWKGLIAHHLMPVEFTPMLSPKLAASAGILTKPKDLLKLPILASGYPWWGQWFQAAGVEHSQSTAKSASQFGPQIMEANAAIAGEGVAMLTPAFFSDALARGDLIQPFPLVCAEKDAAYWLVYPDSHRNAKKVTAFKSWLLKQIAED